ncbi:MAG: hypothetical protein R3268_13355, partial [Acidiferrobacterales bacterium]|nr:hypothetical protein [Acidiferrobacterales bacterium]
RWRKVIAFDEALRKLTLEVIANTRALFDGVETPAAIYEAKRCDHCSLIECCQPQVMGKQRSASRWLARQLQTLSDE